MNKINWKQFRILFDTQANVEAISGVSTWSIAIATDRGSGLKFGYFNGSNWEWIGGGGGAPAGSDKEVQYNNGGAFGANPQFTFDSSAIALILGELGSLPTRDAAFMNVGDNVDPSFSSYAFGSSNFPFWEFSKADGSAASPTNIKNNQIIGTFRARGYNGTNWSTGASELRFVADGDWSGSSRPTRVEFWTTPSGSTTLTLVATIRSDGHVNIGSGKEYRVNGAQHPHAASDITSGTMATARLGSGTADETTFLSGDQTYKSVEWTEISEAWSYASASTITIPSGGTSRYKAGVKIRFKQGGSYKYYVGRLIADTLVTVVVNTDHTVANSAITDIAISYLDNPTGFPTKWNFTCNLTAATTNPTGITTTGFYTVFSWGIKCFVSSVCGASPTNGSGFYRWEVPFSSGVANVAGALHISDANVARYSGSVVQNGTVGSGGRVLGLYSAGLVAGGSPIVTLAVGDQFDFSVELLW